MSTIAHYLNHIPHPTASTPFSQWEKTHQIHLYNIFSMFTDRLGDIDPFTTIHICNQKKYISFAKYLYKKSSRVI